MLKLGLEILEPHENTLPEHNITNTHRRRIEYWKLRAQQSSYKDIRALHSLQNAFRSGNAQAEQRIFWKDVVDRGGAEGECIKMLISTFEEAGDMEGAIKFWRSHLNDDKDDVERRVWYCISEVFDGGSFHAHQIIRLCKEKLRHDPEDHAAVNILIKNSQKSNLEIEDRIALWKGVVQLGCSQPDVVNELESAIADKGDEKYSIALWAALVRRFPSSWYISRAMQKVFDYYGRDKMAIEFWTRMRRVDQRQQHFANFLAESFANAGDYKSAISLWKAWLDIFLSKAQTSSNQSFTENTIIVRLNNALKFDFSLPVIINFWGSSLNRYPAISFSDARQTCLANSVLEYSAQRPHHEVLELVKQAAAVRPDNEDVIRRLREYFLALTHETLEITFWSSQLATGGHWQAWYYARLAQVYYKRMWYGEMLKSVKDVAISDANPDEKLMAVLRPLEIGNKVEFWTSIVESNCSPSWVSQLERACEEENMSWESRLKLWQTLVWKNNFSPPLCAALYSTFRYVMERNLRPDSKSRLRKAEIEAWIQCVREHPNKHHLYTFLARAINLNWSIDICSTGARADEAIKIWKSLLLGLAVKKLDDASFILEQLVDAIRYKSDIVPTDNFEQVLQVWKDAINFWELMMSKFVFGPPLMYIKITTCFDNASAIIQLLETEMH